MPIDPVKIPQNVYIEDRIVGPLTLRQTIMMAVGGGFSYTLWAMIEKVNGEVGIPLTIVAWIPFLVSVAFALIKVNDLSLLRICLLLMERMQKPMVRTFAPRRGISINIRTSNAKASDDVQKQEHAREEQTQKHIQELSSILDQGLAREEDRESAHEEEVKTESVRETPMEQTETPPPRRPVDPNRISANEPEQGFSDLSVFRDIFPQR